MAISEAKKTVRSLRWLQFINLLVVLSMFGVFGVWSWYASVNGAVIAPATIEAESYSKKVQHREGGNVLKILVRDGDQVLAGQDLVVLDPTETRAQLGIVNGQLDEARLKRARLEAQRDFSSEITLPSELSDRKGDPDFKIKLAGQEKLLQSILATATQKQQQYQAEVGQQENQISGHVSQMEADQKQLKIVGAQMENLKKLQTQGLIPTTRIMDMERETARINGELGQLQAQQATAKSKINEINLLVVQVQEDVRSRALADLRDVENRIVELHGQSITMRSRLDHATIKAPIEGTVYGLNVHTEGGVIAPNETLMMILPHNDDLVLAAAIPANDISHVRVGQPAEVMFTAFSGRTTPRIKAEVTRVAADTTKPDPSRGEPQSPPYYAARLTIPAKELEKLGDNKLKPGMSAEAFIETEARSPFSYFVKPLIEQWSHAMRESQ